MGQLSNLVRTGDPPRESPQLFAMAPSEQGLCVTFCDLVLPTQGPSHQVDFSFSG